MSTGTPVRAIEADIPAPAEPDYAVAAPEAAIEWEDDSPAPPRRRAWPIIVAALALLLIAGWTVLFVIGNPAMMRPGASVPQWTGWLSQWSLPVLLIAVAWLIAMRSSTREATRFGNAARRLSDESALLEARLTTVNRELSLAREFLAAQSRELDYLGRAAAERISEHAGTLQALIAENGAQVDAIAGVSQTALANMTELRDDLPVVANSARDVTNQIGGAGRTAKQQLGELIAGFERLNAFGDASERQVTSLQSRIDAALRELTERIDTLDAANAARTQAGLAALRDQAEAWQAELAEAQEAREREEAISLAAMRGRVAIFSEEAREAAAAVRGGEREAMALFEAQIAALRERLTQSIADIAALDSQALDAAQAKVASLKVEAEAFGDRLVERDEALRASFAQRQAALAEAEAEAFRQLEDRSAAFDRALAARLESRAGQVSALDTQTAALAERADEIDGHLAQIVARSEAAERVLAEGAAHFTGAVLENQDRLAEAEAALTGLTEASVRLLELIRAAAAHSRDDLPAAFVEFESRLGQAEGSSAAIRAALQDAGAAGQALDARLAELRTAGGGALGDLDAYRQRLAETVDAQAGALATLRDALSATAQENAALTDSVTGELAAAVEQLRTASAAMLTAFEEEHSERVAALAGRIGEESAAAIDRALETRVADSVAQLDTATARSAHGANQAIAALRDQLARVHELTGNLEARAARAREQVEEQVDSDFARRMALITESLNSHSIDIAKALSTDVTDTAWASYLKGDRGVFTRRAVKLVDGADARAITGLFENDHEFRDHVSRYIHDFEAMLRTLLSTRDGHALGVTLLSSDMGKLYVALAQAIQRLRE